MSKIRVIIAEDHDVVRQGLKILIQADPDLQVAGEAADGQTAVTLTRELHPDVVLMDLALPQVDGLEATRQILLQSPQSRVLVLSSYSDDESVRSLMAAGASGYLTKHSASADLLEAIRKVSLGEHYLSRRIIERMRRQNRIAEVAGHNRGHDLSEREKEVLALIAEGRSTKAAAAELGISAKTAEKHRQSVMWKLDIHDTAGLTRYAASKGLIRSQKQGYAVQGMLPLDLPSDGEPAPLPHDEMAGRARLRRQDSVASSPLRSIG